MVKFSAKERDSETGLSYFGSRYYSSDLSIWLSVDPMSDKYAYQSGYVYCGNNPLKVIDPNEEDEWEINKEGKVSWVCKSETHRLYALDGNGKRTGDYITVKNKSSLDQLYYSYRDSGRSTISGKGFPRHYVYTPNTRTLYYYSVHKSSVFIRGNIRSANDLYRNLAF